MKASLNCCLDSGWVAEMNLTFNSHDETTQKFIERNCLQWQQRIVWWEQRVIILLYDQISKIYPFACDISENDTQKA